MILSGLHSLKTIDFEFYQFMPTLRFFCEKMVKKLFSSYWFLCRILVDVPWYVYFQIMTTFWCYTTCYGPMIFKSVPLTYFFYPGHKLLIRVQNPQRLGFFWNMTKNDRVRAFYTKLALIFFLHRVTVTAPFLITTTSLKLTHKTYNLSRMRGMCNHTQTIQSTLANYYSKRNRNWTSWEWIGKSFREIYKRPSTRILYIIASHPF